MHEFENEKVIGSVETPTVFMRLMASGFVHYSFKPHAEVDETEHQNNHLQLIRLVGQGKKAPLLVDAPTMVNLTAGAREKLKELEPEAPVLCRAMVIQDLGNRLLTGIFIKINKPSIPLKIFSDHESALAWVKTFL